MPPNEPTSFTDEDRARANEIVENIYHDALYHPARFEIVGLLTHALAYIDHLEGTLEAADELARIIKTSLPVPAPAITAALNYRLARAEGPPGR